MTATMQLWLWSSALDSVPNDEMIWVLLAPGIPSGCCLMMEDFVEGLREILGDDLPLPDLVISVNPIVG